MPVDVNDFVLGRGGANWNLPSDGWWNRASYGTRGGGDTRTGTSGGYAAPVINYSGSSGVAPAGGMDLTQLTEYINRLNRQGQQAALRARIPRAQALETQSSANIASSLAGRLPPDVIRLMQQQAAERGVAGGIPGSDNESAAYLRALGLSSLDLQERGQRDLSAAYARNPAAPLFDPATQLLTPYQSQQLALEEQRLNLEAQAEADRTALGYAGLASRGGGGGGGAYGYNNPISSVGDGGFGGEYVGRSTAGGGVTGALLGSPNYGQRNWWSDIGYGTPQAETEADVWSSLGVDLGGAPGGTITTDTGSTAPGYDWSSLFSPDLGIDYSLYGG